MRGMAAFAIAIGAALAGCTVLVSFDAPDEVPVAEADSGAPPPVTPNDAQTGSGPTDSGGVVTPLRDARADFECKDPPPVLLKLCGQTGMVCGRRVADYPGDPENDLLQCEVVYLCRVKCPIGCVKVEGFDDQCDPCKDRPDGTYCGRDVGWNKRNENVSIQCASGKLATTKGCNGKCPCP